MPSDRPRLPATIVALVVGAVLVGLVYAGSRGLRDFDAALIGYAVATVFAACAAAYRYTMWIGRPATWRYFRGGWSSFLSWRKFRQHAPLVPVAWWHDILAQTFIRKRSRQRWIMHMALSWGVLLSCLITVPLTFGWVRFTLVPPSDYRLWVFGFPVFVFPIEAGTGFAAFHALDFTAALLIVGIALALWRRITHVGLLTTQRFGFDLVPLALLLAIAVTGLALTASSMWWEGRFYWFISLTHQVVVVAWLLSLPYGKFFHIVQRPASVGVRLYQSTNPVAGDEAACRRCCAPMPSREFVGDLTATLGDLGQRYDLGAGRGWLQEYCPTCKRLLRGRAYYAKVGREFV